MAVGREAVDLVTYSQHHRSFQKLVGQWVAEAFRILVLCRNLGRGWAGGRFGLVPKGGGWATTTSPDSYFLFYKCRIKNRSVSMLNINDLEGMKAL